MPYLISPQLPVPGPRHQRVIKAVGVKGLEDVCMLYTTKLCSVVYGINLNIIAVILVKCSWGMIFELYFYHQYERSYQLKQRIAQLFRLQDCCHLQRRAPILWGETLWGLALVKIHTIWLFLYLIILKDKALWVIEYFCSLKEISSCVLRNPEMLPQ